MLDGRRLLVTGVLTRHSIAFAIAQRAQELGAEVVLTSFGRALRMTRRAARALPVEPDVLTLDVTEPSDYVTLVDALEQRWDRLDGIVHAIAFAPGEAIGGRFLDADPESAAQAFTVSAFSYKQLAAACAPLLERGDSPGVVGLTFESRVAWPGYDWMGVAKAAMESVSRYVARDLGPRGIRSNLIAAGPLDTPAASALPGLGALRQDWAARAPVGWDGEDAGPVADAACFLMSRLARGVTGEILHVDGGCHAVGAAADEAVNGTGWEVGHGPVRSPAG